MKLLVLSASAGAGHTQAGRALEEAARIVAPRAEIVHKDVLDFASPLYKKAYAGSYLRMIDRAPALWGALYHATNRKRQTKFEEKLSRLHDKIEFARFRRFVRELAPDAVLATHFLPGQVFRPYRSKGKDLFRLGVAITDFDVHAFWIDPTVNRYFVGSEELRFLLASRGIEESRIAVTGIPISQRFAKPPERAAIRKRLGLMEGRPTVLAMSGGAGTGSMEEAVHALFDVPFVQILAVAGRNEALHKKIEKLVPPQGSRLRAFGFVENVQELMAASDLAVTKSGGLTTAECLALGLPMIARDPVPGQEERNCDYLVENGAGLKAIGPEALRFKIRTLLRDPGRLAQMRMAAKLLGRPHAAVEIVRTMLT